MHRTQSEEPPRSPFETNDSHGKSFHTHFDLQSRTSSRQSELETSRSDLHSENLLLSHSRNLSQDSATSYRSIDMTTTSKDSVSMMFGHEHMVPSRVSSRETTVDFLDNGTHGSFESNSLPRRKCAYHADEYQTNSLPRNDRHHYRNFYQQHQSESVESNTFRDDISSINDFLSRENSMDSNQQAQELIKRRYSCGVQEMLSAKSRALVHAAANGTAILFRRNSENNFYHHSSQQCDGHGVDDEDDDDDDDDDNGSDSDEYCSTCESEESGDSQQEHEPQEKEIFIDFKPRLSPTPSSRGHKKKLQKTLSEGEILMEKRRDTIDGEDVVVAAISASEEDLKRGACLLKGSYLYSNIPIKDEGICDKKNLLALPGEADGNNIRNRREAFRKRSISLEEGTGDDEACDISKTGKSGQASPCQEDRLSCKSITEFPSSDSLVNDSTRDHSDGGIWNESQATVLQVEPM